MKNIGRRGRDFLLGGTGCGGVVLCMCMCMCMCVCVCVCVCVYCPHCCITKIEIRNLNRLAGREKDVAHGVLC